MNMNNKETNCICPVCGQSKFDDEFDICNVCFWENDTYQSDNPDEDGGANRLSLSDYKKWWDALEAILPILIKQYDIKSGKRAHWKYDDMIVSRENVSAFINEMTKHNIELCASFYFMCEKYHFNEYTFVGYPSINSQTVKETNDEILDMIFTDDPISVCKKYKMKQVLKILQKSKDIINTWKQLTPHICVMPNPTFLPTF